MARRSLISGALAMAIVAVLASPAAALVPGRYRGILTGRLLTFRVTPRQITHMRFTLSYSCSNGATVKRTTTLAPFALRKNGRFHTTQQLRTPLRGTVKVNGSAVGRTVAGTLNQQYRLGSVTCSSGRTRFSAHFL